MTAITSDQGKTLPVYQCHKKVHALKIGDIEIFDGQTAVIKPANPEYAEFRTVPGWAARYKGARSDPGYYVVYEDGYTSWSPTQAFERGYSLVPIAKQDLSKIKVEQKA